MYSANFFLYLENISNQTVSGLIDFHSIFFPTMAVNETGY